MSEYKMLRVAGGWHVLKGDMVLWPEPSEENAKVIFSLLEQETAPLLARIAELEAALSHCLGTLERTMYINTPNDITEARDHARRVLFKKAGGNG